MAEEGQTTPGADEVLARDRPAGARKTRPAGSKARARLGTAATDASHEAPAPGADDANAIAAPEGQATARRKSRVKAATLGDGELASRKPRSRARSLGTATDPPPGCAAFPIGGEVSVRVATVMRAGEDLSSEELLQLRKGARCLVLEHGVSESGRRLRARELDSQREGWVSCVGQSGRVLLEVRPGRGALLQPDTSEELAGEAPAAERAPSQPEAPQGAAVAVPLTATAAGPPVLGLPRDDASGRAEVIGQLFDALDRGRRGWLGSEELHAYAKLCGFTDGAEEWAREYESLCKLYGCSADSGLGRFTFADLVNDKSGAAYCSDEELRSILSEIELFGVPWESDDLASLPSVTSTPTRQSRSPKGVAQAESGQRFSAATAFQTMLQSPSSSFPGRRRSIAGRLSVLLTSSLKPRSSSVRQMDAE